MQLSLRGKNLVRLEDLYRDRSSILSDPGIHVGEPTRSLLEIVRVDRPHPFRGTDLSHSTHLAPWLTPASSPAARLSASAIGVTPSRHAFASPSSTACPSLGSGTAA